MEIRFDPEKAKTNLSKHGIDFDEAQTALYDMNARVLEDCSHDEQRFILLGMSNRLRLLVVVYAIWDAENEIIRLISARLASKQEQKHYER